MLEGLHRGSRQSGFLFARWGLFFILSCFLTFFGRTGNAQGSFTVLQTGGDQPLVSDQVMLSTDGFDSPAVMFEFGFATDEVPAPNTFLDSFTVTFQDAASDTVVVATVDASGVDWAPLSPGALFLPDSQVQRQAITPPSLAPIFGNGVAYSVQVPVPAAFTSSSMTIYFDLFDNLDANMSAAWFNDVQIISVVPEPGSGWLAALGLMLAAWSRKVRR